jgi:hypothetical protein
MSRIMAPSTRLAQGISTAAVASSVRSSSALAPEYAALLQGRNFRARDSSESSRTMFTTQNPNRVPRSTGATSSSSIYGGARSVDNVTLNNLGGVGRRSVSTTHADHHVRVPIVPDNYSHATTSSSSSSSPAAIAAAASGHFILAANPQNVEPASILTSVKARHCVDEVIPKAGGRSGFLRDLVDGLQEALAKPEPIPVSIRS